MNRQQKVIIGLTIMSALYTVELITAHIRNHKLFEENLTLRAENLLYEMKEEGFVIEKI